MSSTSSHDDLNLVRKPRVHISYTVYTGNAREVIELPFVVGVLGDYSGNAGKPLDPLEKRKFVTIDRDNFDAVMAKMEPGLEFKVPNTLTARPGEEPHEDFTANLKFKSMRDFEPGRVVEQIKPLKDMLDMRNRLRDMASKADRSDELKGLLREILAAGTSGEAFEALRQELGIENPEG